MLVGMTRVGPVSVGIDTSLNGYESDGLINVTLV